MVVKVFLSTRYSVDEPRSDARSAKSSLTSSPRYSVSNAATEPSRRPLMASTSATLLALGTASPPNGKRTVRGPPAWRTPRMTHRGGARLRRRPGGAFVPCGNRTVFGSGDSTTGQDEGAVDNLGQRR